MIFGKLASMKPDLLPMDLLPVPFVTEPTATLNAHGQAGKVIG